MNQYGIDLDKIVCIVCHLQNYDNKDVVAVVETNKQVYLFYLIPNTRPFQLGLYRGLQGTYKSERYS